MKFFPHLISVCALVFSLSTFYRSAQVHETPILQGVHVSGYSIMSEKANQAKADLKSALGTSAVHIYCAGCGPLGDQLVDAFEALGIRYSYTDIPFANPGLWVSPQENPTSTFLAQVLANLTGQEVKLDTLPDASAPDGSGALSSHELAIVISKMPHKGSK